MKKGSTIFRFQKPGRRPDIFIVIGETIGELGPKCVLYNDLGSKIEVYENDIKRYIDAETCDQFETYDSAEWVDVSTPSIQRFIEQTEIGWKHFDEEVAAEVEEANI